MGSNIAVCKDSENITMNGGLIIVNEETDKRMLLNYAADEITYIHPR